MNNTEIEKNIIQITFPPEKPYLFGVNVYIIKEKNKFLLIDSGLRHHGKQLYDYFNHLKIKIDTMIVSHFHEDHIDGIFYLKPQNIYGHHSYLDSLKNWTPENEKDIFFPTNIVKSNVNISYELNQIELSALPGGHSETDLLIFINNKYIHIGDLIIQTPDGNPILSSVKKIILKCIL